MDAAGRFVEGFTWFVNRFGFAIHLCLDRALEDVADDGAGMGVRRGGFPGAIVDFDEDSFQSIAVEFGKRSSKNDAGAFWRIRAR